MALKTTITGVEEVVAALDKMSKGEAKKISRRALKEGSGPLLRRASQEMPVGKTGKLAKSLRMRASKRRDLYGYPKDALGVRLTSPSRAHLLAWIEAGTAERIQRTTGRRTGRMMPTNIMARAARAVGDQVIREVGKSWHGQIVKAWNSA